MRHFGLIHFFRFIYIPVFLFSGVLLKHHTGAQYRAYFRVASMLVDYEEAIYLAGVKRLACYHCYVTPQQIANNENSMLRNPDLYQEQVGSLGIIKKFWTTYLLLTLCLVNPIPRTYCKHR